MHDPESIHSCYPAAVRHRSSDRPAARVEGVLRFIFALPLITLAIGFVLGAYWMYRRGKR
jgi:hypothetical protein